MPGAGDRSDALRPDQHRRGSTVIASGAQAQINPPWAYTSLALTERTLYNHATLTWTSGLPQLTQGAAIANTQTAEADAKPRLSAWQGQRIHMEHWGTITKATRTGTTEIDALLANQGSTSAPAGKLRFGGENDDQEGENEADRPLPTARQITLPAGQGQQNPGLPLDGIDLGPDYTTGQHTRVRLLHAIAEVTCEAAAAATGYALSTPTLPSFRGPAAPAPNLRIVWLNLRHPATPGTPGAAKANTYQTHLGQTQFSTSTGETLNAFTNPSPSRIPRHRTVGLPARDVRAVQAVPRASPHSRMP